MHTYRSNENGLFEVGFFAMLDGDERTTWDKWEPLRVFRNETEAAAFANYMNGGLGRAWQGSDG